MTRFRDRYEEIYDLLSRAELQKGSDGLKEISAGPELFSSGNDRWLGYYTTEGLDTALRKYGFFRDLERLGFRDFHIETRTSDPDEHLFRLWSTKPQLDDPLVELVVRRDFLRPHSELAERLNDSHIPVLTVDWLLLQNPMAPFDTARPPLPGQRHPGLGVGAQVLEMLRNICKRLDLGAIATVPSYFHNALFYSGEFRHFDPDWQGAFLALCRDVVPRVDNSVTAASWALQWELVFDRRDDDVSFPWFQQLMINPMSDELTDYFDDTAFHNDVQKALASHDFDVRGDRLEHRLADRGLDPFDPDALRTWLDSNDG